MGRNGEGGNVASREMTQRTLRTVAARAGNFVAHRAFMIRSFVLMNVFSLIRIAAYLRIEGVPGNEMRILREWARMVLLVLGSEIYLTWWPAIRRLRRRAAVATRRNMI